MNTKKRIRRESSGGSVKNQTEKPEERKRLEKGVAKFIGYPITHKGSLAISRILKIEGVGDFFKGTVKPKVRLTGSWLERAGFRPGNYVHVICVAPGVIDLRSPEVLMLNDAKQVKVERERGSR